MLWKWKTEHNIGEHKVGEGMDLLVTMTESTIFESIFFLKPRRGKKEDALHCPSTVSITPHIRNIIFFLHVFSCCDTRSLILDRKRKKIVKVLDISVLQQVVNIFWDENVCSFWHLWCRAHIIFCAVSGKRHRRNIKFPRFHLYKNSLLKNNISLAYIPPTSAAAQ